MSVTLQILLKKYDNKLLIPAATACADINWSVSKYHNRKSLKVEFPIKLRQNGRAYLVHIADLADYIDNLGTTPNEVKRARDKSKGGRPTKAEAAAKRAEAFARIDQE